MTPEGAADLVTRWVRFYTRRLPAPLAERRIGEIIADLHDHVAHERATGRSDRRIALAILSRMARGVPADASWRRRSRPKGDRMKPLKLLLAVPLIALGVAAFVYGGADDSPGGQLIGVLLVVGGIALGVRTLRRST